MISYRTADFAQTWNLAEWMHRLSTCIKIIKFNMCFGKSVFSLTWEEHARTCMYLSCIRLLMFISFTSFAFCRLKVSKYTVKWKVFLKVLIFILTSNNILCTKYLFTKQMVSFNQTYVWRPTYRHEFATHTCNGTHYFQALKLDYWIL